MKANFDKFNNLSKKTKIIICTVAGILVLAGVIGSSIAIANAVKKSKQEKCEHVYDAGDIKVEATCETPGMIVYTCGECEYELTEEIPANGHAETIIEAVPATCTAKGFTDGVKCITCEEVLVAPVETPLLGHKIETLKGIAATCTTAGKTDGTQCSRCEEIVKAQTVIPAKGHTVVEVKGRAPTCTTAGKTTGSGCSSCGAVYSEQEIIPALGHSDLNGDGACDVCGDFDPETYLEKFSVEGAYTEASVSVGDNVAGKVLRFYRVDTGISQTYVVIDGNVKMPIGAMSKMLYGGISDLPFYMDGQPLGTDGLVASYYPDYVDIYIGVGEYNVEGNEGIYTLKVTSTSKITAIGTTGTVKCLTLNS